MESAIEPTAPPTPQIEVEAPAATGPAAAVSLAAGIGALTLGFLTTLGEASATFKDDLQFNDRVGPLSGKTIIASIVFFASWAVLAVVLRRSNPPIRAVATITAVLIAVGLIGTFPTFFQTFA